MTIELICVGIAAFFASLLTFYSGFGLGTLLTPVFIFFFPIDAAIALTGIVHLSNNLFKLLLVGKKTDITVFLNFGIPAIFAALLGALALTSMSALPPVYSYNLASSHFEVTPLKLLIAFIMAAFALAEMLPAFKQVQFGKDKLVFGGILSGFFGGLAGVQGALRGMFLIKLGLPKEVYIATGVSIACAVDFARLGIYAARIRDVNIAENSAALAAAVTAALAGALLGNRLLKKVTLAAMQNLVAAMLFCIALALALGLI